MNQKEWKTLLNGPKEAIPHGIFKFRNLAEKYFGYKRGSGMVIHHLRDTEEQRNFNDMYYERWGFDLDGEMRYAIMITKEEHAQIHRLSKETLEKMRLAKLGKPLSEQHKKNMSVARKGKTITEASKEKMRESKRCDFKPVYCLETDCVYSSIHEAARELNLFAENISAVCRGKHKHTKGYHFRYAEKEESDYVSILT